MGGVESLLSAALWILVTVGAYLLAGRLHRRSGAWWSSPLLTAPILLLAAAAALHVRYADYIRGPRLLVALLAPSTVAFAVPIYRRRALILRHWGLLTLGVLAGSLVSLVSSWALASWLGLDPRLRLSLLPRSISTPFAMTVSGTLGGVPALTAIFVLITGVAGAAVGEALLAVLPLRSTLARGALFGMGAHGVGTARALKLDPEMGAVAGLVMVLVGILNVLASPLLVRLLIRLHAG